MGVKDKPKESEKEQGSPQNTSNPSLNSKRTFEEFKNGLRSSSPSNQDSDCESDFEDEKSDLCFEISEQIDCLGPDSHWRNAEVVAIRNYEVKVHYTGFMASNEEWIPKHSARLQKQWTKGQAFRVNNRVDVFFGERWLEGLIVDVFPTRIKILIPNLNLKKNAEIIELEKNSEKIAEIGTFSPAFGSGKQKSTIQSSNFAVKEQQFAGLMSKRNLQIKPVQGDGNCLFRSISDQIYGEESFHRAIRRVCMDYIELEAHFFKDFIIQGANPAKFREYIVRKREDGIWGDDIEIQALSEIYDRAIEIYAYSDVPMRTFHEKVGLNKHAVPIRLSYHGSSHFNSIVPKNRANEQMFREKFGRIEDSAIKRARNRRENSESREQEIKELSLMRTDFAKRDLETALQESIRVFEDSLKKMSVKTFENEESERMIVKNALEESRNDEPERELLRRTIEESRRESHPPMNHFANNPFNNTAINRVLSEGFPLEMVLQAFELVGEDPEMMIKFLTENLSYN